MPSEFCFIAVLLLGQLTQPTAPQNSPPESVEVRYARALLQLAEANLKRVEQSNKRMERSVPSSIVAEYQHDVDVAKTRLQATAPGAAGDFQVWLQRAEAERKAAESTWKNARDVNGRVPGTFDAIDIERFRLRAEVAKLQLERGQSLANSNREAKLQWELEVLSNQVQHLQEESRQSTPLTGYFPYWW